MLTREEGLQLLELINIGQRLSNVAWNARVNQGQGHFGNLDTQWDTARKAAWKALDQLHELPPAFDPIYLGC